MNSKLTANMYKYVFLSVFLIAVVGNPCLFEHCPQKDKNACREQERLQYRGQERSNTDKDAYILINIYNKHNVLHKKKF